MTPESYNNRALVRRPGRRRSPRFRRRDGRGSPSQADALDLFERWRPLYNKCGDSEPQQLMPRLERRICRRLGELAGPERRYGEAWRRFCTAGFRQEQTLESLDLAAVWMRREGSVPPCGYSGGVRRA